MDNHHVCRSKYIGGGVIDAALRQEWGEFIKDRCAKTECERRYTTRCCKWGDFEDQRNKKE